MSKFLNISTDNTLGGNNASDDIVSSQKAVKGYVDGHIPANSKLSWYGTCATAAATRNKVVTCAGFTLVEGVSIRVKFTEGQGYNGSCRLNVNGTGNITVYSKDDTASVRYCWNAGEVVGFTYDGTKWIMDDSAIASTTYYGVTKLSSSLTSTSTALAATPSTINGAMQNIVTGYPVYSATSAYAVGDRVRYSSAMYECNTAIAEGGESWNAEHWTQLPAVMTQLDGKINSDGGNSTQTISLTSGSGTTPLTIKSMSNSSYISFMGTNGWIASLGVTNNKKPSLYDGTLHTIAYTTDIPTVNNPTITITQGGVSKGSFTLNQETGDTIALDAGGGGTVDTTLSLTSTNAVENKAISQAIVDLSANINVDAYLDLIIAGGTQDLPMVIQSSYENDLTDIIGGTYVNI